MPSEAIFDVVLQALADQYRQPDRFGGGLIGKAAAVVKALGIDGDAPVSKLRPLAPKEAAGA